MLLGVFLYCSLFALLRCNTAAAVKVELAPVVTMAPLFSNNEMSFSVHSCIQRMQAIRGTTYGDVYDVALGIFS